MTLARRMELHRKINETTGSPRRLAAKWALPACRELLDEVHRLRGVLERLTRSWDSASVETEEAMESLGDAVQRARDALGE
jgi:hypothetical protein